MSPETVATFTGALLFTATATSVTEAAFRLAIICIAGGAQ